jgi:signal transduction histidine kinase
VYGLPEELEQVVRILWQNALDVAPEGGHIWTRTRCEAGFVALQVQDDGPGIAPEHLSRVFTPFFSTKDPGHGLGLGLAIAHQVVTQAGGTISADSALGKGTTFHVRLPEYRASQ